MSYWMLQFNQLFMNVICNMIVAVEESGRIFKFRQIQNV